MKTKFLHKVILIIFLSILFQVTIQPTVVKAGILDDVIAQGKNFIRGGNSKINNGELGNLNSIIFNMLFGIGVALTVGVGGVLGIQFVIASAEDKAKIKEKMIPYIIGCIIIFGAFAIWKIVVALLVRIA